MATKLDATARNTALAGLTAWSHDEGADSIFRTFSFKNFSEAFAFMTRVALAAEAADHHPDWSNSYNKVTISLSTHSAGGLTELDIALATKIDKLVS
jgi:4a-hydroxytetrahydrobiopterin dehydratase